MHSKQRLRAIGHEIYKTPEYVYSKLFHYHPRWFKGLVLDPSAGDGRMVRWLQNHGNRRCHTLCDIRPEELKVWRRHLPNCQHHTVDFLQWTTKQRYRCVVTNPPFTRAQVFVEHSLQFVHQRGYVCILQALNWLGTQRRSAWLKNSGLFKVLIVAKRPAWEVPGLIFAGTNTYDYAWYIFRKGYRGLPTVDWLL